MTRRRGTSLLAAAVALSILAVGTSRAQQSGMQRTTTGGTYHGSYLLCDTVGCNDAPEGYGYCLNSNANGTVSLPGRLWIGTIWISGCGEYDPESGAAMIPSFTVDKKFLTESGYPKPVRESLAHRRLTGECSGLGGSADHSQGGVSFGTVLSRIKLICELRIGFSNTERVVIFAVMVTAAQPPVSNFHEFAGAWHGYARAPASL